MDFIVSKVAMSICALLVASALSGVFGDELLFSRANELDSILANLSTTIERSAWSNSEGTTVWKIPFLSNGDTVVISIQGSNLRASSSEKSEMMSIGCEAHTWAWNGTSLNSTSVKALEESSPPIESCSGHGFQIEAREVRYENGNAMFVFMGVVD